MARESASSGSVSLTPWNPAKALRVFEENEVEMSRGFLRCTPQQWFPALPAQWLPLTHALSVEVAVQEVKTAIELLPTQQMTVGYQATLDGELVAVLLDEHAVSVLLSGLSPDGLEAANDIVLEYIARRTLGSLALAWSGHESSVLRFHSVIDPYSVEFPGYVQVSIKINNETCSVWFGLAAGIVEKMDGLWRRQIQLRTRSSEINGEYSLELAQLGVPPSMLTQYVKSGTVIDLETVASDKAYLRGAGDQVLPCRIFKVKKHFGVELLQTPGNIPSVPKGTTRLSICFGKVSISPEILTEISQPRALWDTGITLTDQIQMVINGEKVASAQLGIYEGRFALTVV